MEVADKSELEKFLQAYPETQMLEVLMPDINGIPRSKRIHRREFDALFSSTLKAPITLPLLGIRGDLYDEGLDQSLVAGDPDQLVLPVSGSLAPLPWVDSPTAQVLAGFADLEGGASWVDPRNALVNTLGRLRAGGLHPVVATELEFYLLAESDDPVPRRLQGRIAGTGMHQQGIQYCMAEDLWECDAFLDDVRRACELQHVPLTAIHSEFSSGQWEINTTTLMTR